jgi:multimeric flavodoxin WrbA
MTKILILAGSPRKDANTLVLSAALAEGAAAHGADVETVRLADLRIGYCLACDHCRSHGGVCIQEDDMPAVLAKVESADAVVFATPLYFHSFSAQLKTCIDRFYSRYHARALGGRTGALLVSSGTRDRAATGLASLITTYASIIGLLGWKDGGIVWAGGHPHDGSILTSPAVAEARALGARLAAGGDDAGAAEAGTWPR